MNKNYIDYSSRRWWKNATYDLEAVLVQKKNVVYSFFSRTAWGHYVNLLCMVVYCVVKVIYPKYLKKSAQCIWADKMGWFWQIGLYIKLFSNLKNYNNLEFNSKFSSQFTKHFHPKNLNLIHGLSFYCTPNHISFART